jgi:hypothetical protein
MPENNGTSRLDRIERALELLIDDHVQFREEHKMLLTAQVLLTEAQKRTEEAQKRTDEKLAKLAITMDALALTVDEIGGKLNALIKVVDGVVRNPPRT